jgi:hypothetical protein
VLSVVNYSSPQVANTFRASVPHRIDYGHDYDNDNDNDNDSDNDPYSALDVDNHVSLVLRQRLRSS